MVQAGEAGNGEGVVEPGVDELLRQRGRGGMERAGHKRSTADRQRSCGVVSKNLANSQPLRSRSFSCAMTIFSLSWRACLTCSASLSSDQVSAFR